MEPEEPWSPIAEGLKGASRSPSPQYFSRVINVVSREESSSLENLPQHKPLSLSSRHQSRLLSEQSRSRSLSDMRPGQRKPANFPHHWKNESRVLPSCQANPRRNHGGVKCNSPTPTTFSNHSGFSQSRDNLSPDQSHPISTGRYVKSHKRNKSDSNLTPHTVAPSLSASLGEDMDKIGVSPSGDFLGSFVKNEPTLDTSVVPKEKQKQVQHGSNFKSIKKHFLKISERLLGRRRRNHSDSEITDSFSDNPDMEDSFASLSRTSRHLPKHRSLESLTSTDNPALFPDFLPGSLGAPEIDTGSQEWGPALSTASISGSMENLNNTRIMWCGTSDESDDDLNVSWPSSEIKNSARDSPICPAEDYMFTYLEGTRDDSRKLFQKDVKWRESDTAPNSDCISTRKEHVTTDWKKSEKTSKSVENVSIMSDSHKNEWMTSAASVGRGHGDTADSATVTSKPFNPPSCKPDQEAPDSRSILVSVPVTQHEVSDANKLSKTFKNEQRSQSCVSKSEQPSSVLLPHLKRTLETVRKRIKSKKASLPSKIPVRIKQQISPRERHQKRNTARRSSYDSSTKCVSPEPSSEYPLPDSEIALEPEANSFNRCSVGNSGQPSPFSEPKLSVENSEPLCKPPKPQKATKVSRDNSSVAEGQFPVWHVDGDKFSVFSPRPPRGLAHSISMPHVENIDHHGFNYLEVSKSVSNTDLSSLQGQCQSQSSSHSVSSSHEDLEASTRGSRLSTHSPRRRREQYSPRTSNEGNSPRRHRYKTSSRVEYLLSNDLFMKNLSGHVDLVEKNILQIKKFGLKKSFSNLDLTVSDTQRLHAAFESSLKQQNIELEERVQDEESRNQNENKSDNREGMDDESQSPASSSTQVLSNKPTDASQTPRRKSLACDDPSLHQLREILQQGQPVPSIVVTNAVKRGRLYIPSFDEFRKVRYKVEGKSTSDSADGLQVSDDAAVRCADMPMNYRPLDTITEDDGAETARASTHGRDKESAPNTKGETEMANMLKCKDGIKSEDLSVSCGFKPENAESAFQRERKKMQKDSRTPHNQHYADRSEVSVGERDYRPERFSKQTHIPVTHNVIPGQKHLTNHTGVEKLQRTLSGVPAGQQTTKSSSEADDNVKASASTKSCTITKTTGHYSNTERSGTQPTTDLSGALVDTAAHADKPDLQLESKIRDVSDQGQSDRLSLNDLPSTLFNETADALDTQSWARLFMENHKPRKKNESRKGARYTPKQARTSTVQVLRSSSDVTGELSSGGQSGQRQRRHRKERPYKSDPLAEGAGLASHGGSRQQGVLGVMRFLEEGVDKGVSHTSSFPSLEELMEESSAEDSETENSDDEGKKKRLSCASTGSEDSGVMGQDGAPADLSPLAILPPRHPSHTSPHVKMMNCLHCHPGDGQPPAETEPETEEAGLCDKCLHRQQERKETIYEIIETEINYGRDLRILKEEFFVPMQTTGLLTPEQLDTVFINLNDLITINVQLTEKLRSALHSAASSRDQDLNLVNIGSIFIESSTMFLAFESYCINQAQASASLEQLERERELLRIFLQVSQTENSVLRRMHLKSFLMVPVQRIMKYPLLLNRLYKATPSHHRDKDDIRQAREKIEDILEHINAKAKGSGSVRIKRKQSDLHRYSLTEKIEVNRVALELLGWSQKEVVDLITSRMWYAQPSDHTWATKRCRNIKFTGVHAVLLTWTQNQNNNMVLGQQAAMVLVREKNGKYQAVRDPFLLEKSVVTVDPECDDVFELQEWGREAYIFKAEDPGETRQWVQHLRQQTHNLGQWRRRRNALPNIMLKNK